MNDKNPLVPQGSFLEQKSNGRARFRIAVFFVLAVHGLGLMALLMQGCNKPPEPPPPPTPAVEPETSAPPLFEAPSNVPPPAAETSPAIPPSTYSAPPEAPPVETAPPSAPAGMSAPVAGMTEYKIAPGDTFSALAKKYHVSVKALMDANPGIEPTRLQIGQAIQIPPAAPPPALALTPGASTSAPVSQGAGGEIIYSVKSGDNLTRIAHHFGVSIRALRSANDLKTDRIVVGQKLKIPGKASAPTLPGVPEQAPPPVETSTPAGLPPGQ